MARRLPIAWMIVALAGGLAAGLLVLRSGAPPELTRAELAAARELWGAAGPRDYSYVLQMGGTLSDRRRVVVRAGRVVEMTIDGQAATPEARDHWSVDALFDFLATELRNREDPPPALGVGGPDQIVLRARFDAELGYPTQFLRHLLGRQQGTAWEILEFRVEMP